MNPKISIICALDEKRGIGKDNKLMWNIPADLKRFREITSGHPIIMGRKTFESIGRVLPNRINIIVTRDQNYAVEGAVIVHSFEDAIQKAQDVIATQSEAKGKQSHEGIAAVADGSLAMTQREVFVIGGGQIFEQALPFASKLYLTIVKGDFGADAFFPEYPQFTKKTFEEIHKEGEYEYTFVNLEKE